MTRFNEYDVVSLRREVPEHGLKPGARGTVLVVFRDAKPPAYEVEFLRADGTTRALVTLSEDLLSLTERPT